MSKNSQRKRRVVFFNFPQKKVKFGQQPQAPQHLKKTFEPHTNKCSCEQSSHIVLCST